MVTVEVGTVVVGVDTAGTASGMGKQRLVVGVGVGTTGTASGKQRLGIDPGSDIGKPCLDVGVGVGTAGTASGTGKQCLGVGVGVGVGTVTTTTAIGRPDLCVTVRKVARRSLAAEGAVGTVHAHVSTSGSTRASTSDGGGGSTSGGSTSDKRMGAEG